MEELLEIGITDEQLDYLYESLDDEVIDQINLMPYRVSDNVGYFIKLGFTNVVDLLVVCPDVFYMAREELKKRVEFYGVDKLNILLNEDILNIDILLKPIN